MNSTLQSYRLPDLSNAVLLEMILVGDERLSVNSIQLSNFKMHMCNTTF